MQEQQATIESLQNIVNDQSGLIRSQQSELTELRSRLERLESGPAK